MNLSLQNLSTIHHSRILVFILIFSLFSDINFFGIGDFVISLKFLATSLGTLLMIFSVRYLDFNFYFIKFSFLFYFLFNMPQIFSGNLELTKLTYFLSYGIFLTVFVDYIRQKKLSRFFFTTFVYISVFTSIVACFQVFGILPVIENKVENFVLESYNINQGDILNSAFKRGTGFMFDGNFFGMTLAIGYAINKSLFKSKKIAFIILMGVLASFSRSALLAVLFTHLFTLDYAKITLRNILNFLTITILSIAFFFAMYELFPNSIFTYFSDRIFELFEVVFFFNIDISNESILDSSTSLRFFSILAAYYIFMQNPFIGVGIDGSRIAFKEFLGFNTVAHNTFIEFFVVAGIFGLIPTYIFLKQFFEKVKFRQTNLNLYKSILGAIFISFLTLTHMQSLILFFPFFFRKLIENFDMQYG
ncbi:MAG: O-antigen ligase family protein [Flavobacteriaceae bacterium]|nr:O-antigen ligase family protein [Flavobacteriaceae bacterium]MBL6685111.1 O-antigen ligase family protein [Flavobacteriaceae bacterium]